MAHRGVFPQPKAVVENQEFYRNHQERSRDTNMDCLDHHAHTLLAQACGQVQVGAGQPCCLAKIEHIHQN